MDIRSDAKGLLNREFINRNNEKYNFAEWVEKILNPQVGMQVLDIGCGVGKQILPLSTKILPNGHIIGIDISQEALNIINEKVKIQNIKSITTLCLEMDDITKKLFNKRFDLIYSVYAFYYSNNMLQLLIDISSILKYDGKIVLFGPGNKSNKELIDIINVIEKGHSKYYKDFLSHKKLITLKNEFDLIEIERFENVVFFLDPHDFMIWYQTSELYDCKLQDIILEKIGSIIKDYGKFQLTKETVAITLKKVTNEKI